MPSKSKAQQRFMGAVYQCKKTGKGCTGEVGKAAKSMSKKDAKKFASTKHSGLPERVAEKMTFTEFLITEMHNIDEIIYRAYKRSNKTRSDFMIKMKEESGGMLSSGRIRKMMRDDPEFQQLQFVD